MRAAVGNTVSLVSDPFGFGDQEIDDVEVTVTRANGEELVEPASSVTDAMAVRVLLTAADHLDLLDELTVTIAATVDGADALQTHVVDVVGSHWVPVAQVRAEPRMDDLTKYPDELVVAVRDAWETKIEAWCRRHFTPGYVVERHVAGPGCSVALSTQDITSVRYVSVDGVSVDVGDVEVSPSSVLTLPTQPDRRATVEVHVEAGSTRPPPQLVLEVRRAIRRDLLARSAQTPNDVIRETSPEGGVTIQYSTPDPERGRYTGILTLDPIIHDLRRDALGFA